MRNNPEELRYLYSSKHWWQYDPKYYVLDKINPEDRVLDVGCSYGDFGSKIKEKGCSVEGVEFYGPAIEQAINVLDNVYQIDLNNYSDIKQKINSKYDVITFMDVLEHLINPEMVLSIFKEKLVKGGRVYISVPNIANIKNRLKLLLGNFDYTEYGVLDKTHLRFFTKKTATALVQNLFNNANIVACTPAVQRFGGRPALTLVKISPELFSLQFVIEGRD